MAMTTQTLGLGRKVLKDVYLVEAKKVDPQWRGIVGDVPKTTQIFETYRQMKGLGPAEPTPEGEQIRYDDITPLFSRNFSPYLVTKGLKYTELLDYTLQYKDVLAKQPMFARSFGMTRNQVVANMLNLGFSDTTYGMNNEPLFSTTHATALGSSASNRPLTELALSPLAVEQGLAELRRQKSAIGQPMSITGKVNLVVPPELEPLAYRIVNSMQFALTNNNDTNAFIRRRVEVVVNDYLTSPRAWFLIAQDPAINQLFLLEQLPYRIDQLAMSDDLFIKWAAREAYVPGWIDWRGTWGTMGA